MHTNLMMDSEFTCLTTVQQVSDDACFYVCDFLPLVLFNYIIFINNTLHFPVVGYVANFRVDLRDGTTIASMMSQVLEGYNVPGTNVFADNAFVSVEMLRWCRDNGINLCGTTRVQYGFPQDLRHCFDQMRVCIMHHLPNPNYV